MSEEEKKAIIDLIDSSNLSLIGDGTIIISSQTISILLNLIEKQQRELQLKDKVIDLICWTITHQDIPTEEYCKIRTIGCEEVGGSTYECKDCIKQYFINKIKENE